MVRQTLAIASIAVLAACASRGTPPVPSGHADEQAAAPATIRDSAIGLAPGSAFTQPAQLPVPENPSFPGESTPKTRPFAGFPPVIPHSIDGLDTITLDENACLECHDTGVAADAGAPPVPATHRIDLRRTPGVVGDAVVGSRWVCTSCHAAWRDTKPLVSGR